MAILATIPGLNLFSNLPTIPPRNDPSTSTSHSAKTPIPIPKYPPPLRYRKSSRTPPKKPPNPAFKTHHRNSKYYKPVKEGQVISSDDDRSVIIGDSGVSYRLPGAPFDFQFSYSETPKAKPTAIREPAFLPFAPPTMARPWTGKAPLKKSKKNIRLFEPLNSPPSETNGGKRLEMLKSYRLGKYSGVEKPKKEVLGKPLTRAEIHDLVKPHLSSNRQVNLGRDGLTHNMLELIHTHWRRRPVCKVRCLGVPTVDMDNVCRCLEEKTGGKIIHRVGGNVYIFCGRNYDPRTRPQYPVMLWKPAAPVYPKLIQDAPEGLTKEEADEFRMKGEDLLPICKLAKNGVYISLVKDVRNAFEECPLVKIDCTGLEPSDYKKIGAKLKELVPCVLLSFDEEQILMWRGSDWKSMHGDYRSPSSPLYIGSASDSAGQSIGSPLSADNKTVNSSPRMMSLWKRAIESSKAMLLDETALAPDVLLEKVEEFESISQVMVHSYPARILSDENGSESSQDEEDHEVDDEAFTNACDEDLDIDDLFEGAESSSVPFGSLPVDLISGSSRTSRTES